MLGRLGCRVCYARRDLRTAARLESLCALLWWPPMLSLADDELNVSRRYGCAGVVARHTASARERLGRNTGAQNAQQIEDTPCTVGRSKAAAS